MVDSKVKSTKIEDAIPEEKTEPPPYQTYKEYQAAVWADRDKKYRDRKEVLGAFNSKDRWFKMTNFPDNLTGTNIAPAQLKSGIAKLVHMLSEEEWIPDDVDRYMRDTCQVQQAHPRQGYYDMTGKEIDGFADNAKTTAIESIIGTLATWVSECAMGDNAEIVPPDAVCRLIEFRTQFSANAGAWKDSSKVKPTIVPTTGLDRLVWDYEADNLFVTNHYDSFWQVVDEKGNPYKLLST
jgi:hypothetical protein